MHKAIDPQGVYDSLLGTFEYSLSEITDLESAYLDTGEFTVEELHEHFPQIKLEKDVTAEIIRKMKDEKTAKWFLDMMTEQLNKELTEEDQENISKGLDALERAEKILDLGAETLLEVILPPEDKPSLN